MISTEEYSNVLADLLIAESKAQSMSTTFASHCTTPTGQHQGNEGSPPSSHMTFAMLAGWEELSNEDEYHSGSSFDEAFEDLSAIRSESASILGVQEGITHLTQQMFAYMGQQ